MLPFQHLLDVALEAAAHAAAFVRRSAPPADPARWQSKGPNDFVTEIDRTAEAMITDLLRRATPDAGFLGEELTPNAADTDLQWIVDPLDGTTNFLHGYPQYAVSIAAAVGGELAAGVVHAIPTDAVSCATRGGGAWCNGTRLAVTRLANPGLALIGTGFPFKAPRLLPDYLAQMARVLQATSGIRRAGAAALDLADLAAGRLDAFWELSLAPWDVAAGSLLVREAGGCVTNLEGSPDVLTHGSIVAGGPMLHEWLHRTLQNSR